MFKTITNFFTGGEKDEEQPPSTQYIQGKRQQQQQQRSVSPQQSMFATPQQATPPLRVQQQTRFQIRQDQLPPLRQTSVSLKQGGGKQQQQQQQQQPQQQYTQSQQLAKAIVDHAAGQVKTAQQEVKQAVQQEQQQKQLLQTQIEQQAQKIVPIELTDQLQKVKQAEDYTRKTKQVYQKTLAYSEQIATILDQMKRAKQQLQRSKQQQQFKTAKQSQSVGVFDMKSRQVYQKALEYTQEIHTLLQNLKADKQKVRQQVGRQQQQAQRLKTAPTQQQKNKKLIHYKTLDGNQLLMSLSMDPNTKCCVAQSMGQKTRIRFPPKPNQQLTKV